MKSEVTFNEIYEPIRPNRHLAVLPVVRLAQNFLPLFPHSIPPSTGITLGKFPSALLWGGPGQHSINVFHNKTCTRSAMESVIEIVGEQPECLVDRLLGRSDTWNPALSIVLEQSNGP